FAACVAGRAAPPRKRRTKNITAKITRPISTMLDSASNKGPPKPKLDNSAAMPKPAAIPAIGPKKREKPLLGCCAALLRAALALAGVAALRLAVAAGGCTA